MSVIVKGGGGKPEEEKTVTAGTSAKVVTPSDGKTIKKVTVNPTPSQSKTVSPSTSQQTVSPDAGKMLSQVIVNAMASGALSDITVSASGLITAQIGTSGYLASGTKKTKQLTKQAAKTVIPSESVQTAVASGRYTTGAVKVAAIPSTYVKIANLLGYTSIDYGEFTLSSRVKVESNPISHNLGVVPKLFILFSESPNGKEKYDVAGAILNTGWNLKTAGTPTGENYEKIGIAMRYENSDNGIWGTPLTWVQNITSTMYTQVSDSSVKLGMSGNGYFSAGVKYRYIACA